MRNRKAFMMCSLLAASFVAVPTPAPAQDPAVVNARTIHVTFENDRVRVLEATLPPGEKEQLHSHPAYVIYVITGGKVRNHSADGTVTESDLAAGATIYRDPLTHWAENIGKTTIHEILVELKSPPQPAAGH